MRHQLVEGKVEATEEKATAIEVMAKATKEEVARVVEQYKNFTNFKDEVNEAIYNAYHKDFEEYKRKVMQAFHFPDLKDLITNEPEGGEEEGVIDVRGEEVEVSEGTGSKIDTEPS